MTKKREYLVYALVDPRTCEWRYVGKSSSGLSRPRMHRLPSSLRKGASPHKDNWIRGLQKCGLEYEILTLETCETAGQLNQAEIDWIAAARAAGVPLLNKTNGGDGKPEGIWHTEESRKKMSARLKGRTSPHSRAPQNVARLKKLSATNASREHQLKLARKRGVSPIWDSDGRQFELISDAAKFHRLAPQNIRYVLTGKGHFIKGISFTCDPDKVATLKQDTLEAFHAAKRSALAWKRRPVVDDLGVRYESQSDAARKLGLVGAGNISTHLSRKRVRKIAGRVLSRVEEVVS